VLKPWRELEKVPPETTRQRGGPRRKLSPPNVGSKRATDRLDAAAVTSGAERRIASRYVPKGAKLKLKQKSTPLAGVQRVPNVVEHRPRGGEGERGPKVGRSVR